MAKASKPWSWDAKKIHILNYLDANRSMGGIRNTFLRMPKKDVNSAVIGSKEIGPIIEELLAEEFIFKDKNVRGDVYKITPKGIDFIVGLKNLKGRVATRFFFLDSLDEPTDRAPTR